MAIDKMKGKTGQSQLDSTAKTTKSDFDESKKTLAELEEKEEKLKASVNKAETYDERERIKDKIEQTQKRIQTETQNVNDLKKASEGATTAAKENEDKVKGIFGKRVETYADTFAKENALWTWSKNVLKVGTVGSIGAIAGGTVGALTGATNAPSITTPADKKEIARAIRKVSKDKTPDEVIAEQAAKKARKERNERKASGTMTDEDKDEDETPAEQAPTTTPPAGGAGTPPKPTT